MSDFFNVPERTEAEAMRNILRKSEGKCMCSGIRHSHKSGKCNRPVSRPYHVFDELQTGHPINSRTWIVVCTPCARFYKDAGY